MKTEIENFIEKSKTSVSDQARKNIIDAALQTYTQHHNTALEQFSSVNTVKQKAAHIRWKAINNLEKYLIEFESVFHKNGGKLIWTQNAEQAVDEIENIIRQHQSNILYKSKSAVCDEINLVDALSERGIKSIETDTGQFIIKQNNEKAEHMVVPAIHKSKSDVFELLKNDFDFDAKSDVHQAVNFTSNLIKEKIKEGKVTISGANFLCADAGAIAITENEGNIFYSIGNAKAHIVITCIDKMLPSINDLDLFLPLLSTFASGESLSSFNHIITAPQKGKELYLILLDNGRSNALSDKETRPVMSCIKCGACQNVCPVLRATGNIALSFEHGGPSGNLQNALKNNPKEQSHLFELSTLCGKCDTVCPVNINLHKLYLYGRKNHSDQNNGLSTGKLNMFLWKKSVAKRGAYNFASGKMRKVVVETYFKSGLKPYNLTLSEKSFNDMWREQMMLN